MRYLLLASLVLISGCSAQALEKKAAMTDEARLAEALEGLHPGKPQGCLTQSRRLTYHTESIGNVILYKIGRDLIYRNDTTGGCRGSALGESLVSVNPGPDLCRGQIIRSVNLNTGTETGSCALGDFTPYRK